MDIQSSAPQVMAQTQWAMQQHQITSLNQQRLKTRENPTELMKTAKQFEGLMLQQLLKSMDKTIQRSDFLGGSHAESMYRDMLYEQIAQNATEGKTGSQLGLADLIYKQMKPFVPDDQPSASNSPTALNQIKTLNNSSTTTANPMKPYQP